MKFKDLSENNGSSKKKCHLKDPFSGTFASPLANAPSSWLQNYQKQVNNQDCTKTMYEMARMKVVKHKYDCETVFWFFFIFDDCKIIEIYEKKSNQ